MKNTGTPYASWKDDGKYDVMYFVEAFDKQGNGRMFPDMEKETPYIIVRLDRGSPGNQGHRAGGDRRSRHGR